MPLYLGLDAAPEGLNAIVIEVEGEVRRVVFNRSLTFDRDLPEYGTTGGLRRTGSGDVPASPVMWADALDRMMGRLAAAAEIEVERIRAIAGCAQPHHTLELNQRVAESAALEPSVPLATQLRAAGGPTRQVDSITAYLESLIAGADRRLSAYWRKRYALPAAAVVGWTDDRTASAIGTGIVRDGVIAVAFGTNDTVLARATEAPGASLVTFRNGSLARELVRLEHRLDWDAIARLLEASPGNDGWVMLPWVEPEITPPVRRAGVRRFGFDRHDTARNVCGLIEGQLMAMANHAPVGGATVEKVIATGGAASNRAILQVTANVFGAEVFRLDTAPRAALGAALGAYHADRLAAGDPVSWTTVVSGFTDPQPGHRVSPNPKHVAMYAELRKDYAMLERLHRDRPPIC